MSRIYLSGQELDDRINDFLNRKTHQLTVKESHLRALKNPRKMLDASAFNPNSEKYSYNY